jgi:hypothetical protein
MSAAKAEDGWHQWEQSKENVLPIKRGRSTKGLQDAFSKPLIAQHNGNNGSDGVPEQESIEVLREQIFEEDIKVAATVGPSDVLESYLKYLKWVRDRFPTNADKALKLMEVSLTKNDSN